jgi:hypothetical protein
MATIDTASFLHGIIGYPTGWAALDPTNMVGYILAAMEKTIKDQIEAEDMWLYNRLRSTKKGWNGSVVRFPINVERIGNIFVTDSDGGPILEGDGANIVWGTAEKTTLAGPLAITDDMMNNVGGENTVVDVVTMLVEGMINGIKSDVNKGCYLDGTGVLATIAVVAPTWTVTDVPLPPTGFGTDVPSGSYVNATRVDTAQRLVRNHPYEIWPAARIGAKRCTLYVKKIALIVGPAGGTTTHVEWSATRGGVALTQAQLAAAPYNVIATDVVCIRGSQNATVAARKFIHGLAYHIDDASGGTHQSIDPLQVPEWQSVMFENGGVGRDLTVALVQEWLQAWAASANDKSKKTVIYHPFLNIKYAGWFDEPYWEKQPDGQPATLGTGGPKFKSGRNSPDLEYIEDSSCDYGTMIGIKFSDFVYRVKRDWGWRNLTASASLKPSAMPGALAASDSAFIFKGVYYSDAQLTVERRNTHSMFKDINVTVPRTITF